MSKKIVLIPPRPLPVLPKVTTGTALINDSSVVRPGEVIEGVLSQATKGVLAGVSKAGKTWLLLFLTICVATGRKFLKFRTVKAPVLFINLEIPPAFIKERLMTLMGAMGITDCGHLDIWNLRGQVSNYVDLFAHIIKEAVGKGYSLIIIDPYYKLLNGKSENTAAAVSKFVASLEKVAEVTGAAILYSHHFAKGDTKKKSAIDRLSGSGVFARDADTIWTMTEHTEPDCFTVEFVLRNLPNQPSFVIERKFPLFVERTDLDPEDVMVPNVDDENDHGITDLIRNVPKTTFEWEIMCGAMGLSRATFFRIKRKLRDNGYIDFDFKTKTWFVVVGQKTSETGETSGTCKPVIDVDVVASPDGKA
jgi:hypothetical protein